MENASKALLMAASVLVGILILSLIAYLYTVFGDYSSLIQARLKKKKTLLNLIPSLPNMRAIKMKMEIGKILAKQVR